MQAYIYRAAFYCVECGERLKTNLDESFAENGAMPGSADDDSDRYPQGPFDSGGGEADTPQHCDGCGVFLENPLTDDGRDYVREAVDNGHGLVASDGRLHVVWNNPAVQEWSEFYGIKPGEE